MPIIKNDIKSCFTIIPNSAIQATDLTDAEYRLLMYLYFLPDFWKINQDELGKKLNCSRININKKIKKLKELGYLEIIKNSETKDYDYILKEKDVSLTDVSLSDVSSSDVSPTDTHNNTIYNNTIVNNTKLKNNIERNIKERFSKPTIEELKKYCEENSLKVDCDYFYDYYESNGWVVSKSKMKDWKATLRNWNRRNFVKQTEIKSENIQEDENGYVKYGIDGGILWGYRANGKRFYIKKVEE